MKSRMLSRLHVFLCLGVVLSCTAEVTNYVGHVTDPLGNPVTNATIVLKVNAADIPSSAGAAQGVTDENGNYSITHVASDYVISASKTGYMIVSDSVQAINPVKNLQFVSNTRNIPAMEWLLFAADSADLPAVGGTGDWNLDYCTFDNRTSLQQIGSTPAIVSEYGLKWVQGTGNLSSYRLNRYDWTAPVPANGASILSVVKIGNIANKVNDWRDGQSVIVSFFNESLVLSLYRDGRVLATRNNVRTQSTVTFSQGQTVLFSMVLKPDGTFKVWARVFDIVTERFGDATEIINVTATSPFTAFNPGGAWWLRQIQVGCLYGNGVLEGRTYWDGLIGDTFVYKGALTDADRVTLENDIVSKTEAAAQNSWKLEVTSSGNGSVNPAGTVLVPKGTDQVFSCVPAMGWQLSTVSLDGNSPISINGSAWTNVNVSADGAVHFTFSQLPPKSVTGTVKNSLNEPVAGARVILKANAYDLPTAAGAQQTTTGPDGSYTFSSVVSIAYTLVVAETGYRIQLDTVGQGETVKDVILSQRSRFVPGMEWLLFGATAAGLGVANSTADWSLMYVDLPGYGQFDSSAVSINKASVTNLLSTKWGTMNGWDGGWNQFACAYRVNRWGDWATPIPVNGASAVVLATVGNLNAPFKGGANSVLFTIFNAEFSLGLTAGGQVFVQHKWETSATSAQSFAAGQTVLFSCVVQTNRSCEVWARVQNPDDFSFGAPQKVIETVKTSSFVSLNPGNDWWVRQVNIGNQHGNSQWEGANYWAGGIGDTFVFKTALSASDRTLLERDVVNDWASRKGAGTVEFDCSSGSPMPGSVEMANGDMNPFTFSFANGNDLDISKNNYRVATAAPGVTLTGIPAISGLAGGWKLVNSNNSLVLKFNGGTIIILH